MIASIIIIGIIGAVFLLTQSTEVVRRGALTLMWSALLLYPGVYALINGREVYGVESSARWAALFTPVVFIFHALVISSGILVLLLSRRNGERPGKDLRAVVVIYFLTQMVVILLHSAWSALTGWLTAMVVALVLVSAPERPSLTERRIRLWLRSYIIASAMAALVVPEWAWVPETSNSRSLFGFEDRLIGFTSGSNYLGVVSALSFALETGNSLRGDRRSKYFAVLALAACVLSQSRSPILAIILIAVFALAIRLRIVVLARPRVSLTLVVLVLFSFLPVLFLLLGNSRTGAMLQEITTGRVTIWQTVFAMVRESPWIGHGPNVFTQNYWAEYSVSQSFSNAHNQWLESASRGGIVETLGLLIFLVGLVNMISRSRNSEFGFVVLAVGMVIFVQLAIGTPFRLSGITWNLVQFSTLLGIGMASCTQYKPCSPSGELTKESPRKDSQLANITGK